MNVLLISYYYGTTASGVISRRVAESMATNGIIVEIITSSRVDSTNDRISIHSIVNHSASNSFINKVITRIQSVKFLYITNFIWRRRVEKYVCTFLNNHKIDVLYCRSSPVDACLVGEMIRKKYNLPILQHFSDPIPPPLEYLPNSRRRSILINRIKEVLNGCNMVSFGNEFMANYVQEQCSISFNDKLFISPDMASGEQIEYYYRKRGQTIVLTYLGNIYGGRNPRFLYEAINELNNKGSHIELRIYSEVEKSITDKYTFVKSYPKTKSIIKVLADSDILVDIDGDDKVPVFISSKLKDYLLINRPILSITPLNSPSRILLRDLNSVCVVENKSRLIAEGIQRIVNTNITDDCYCERKSLIKQFCPTVVVNGIIDNLQKIINTM